MSKLGEIGWSDERAMSNLKQWKPYITISDREIRRGLDDDLETQNAPNPVDARPEPEHGNLDVDSSCACDDYEKALPDGLPEPEPEQSNTDSVVGAVDGYMRMVYEVLFKTIVQWDHAKKAIVQIRPIIEKLVNECKSISELEKVTFAENQRLRRVVELQKGINADLLEDAMEGNGNMEKVERPDEAGSIDALRERNDVNIVGGSVTCDLVSADEIMWEIFGKLMLHKPETKHVEKVVRPIVEKLVNERAFAYDSCNHWMDKFTKEFGYARKVEQENEVMQEVVERARGMCIFDEFGTPMINNTKLCELKFALAKYDALKGGE